MSSYILCIHIIHMLYTRTMASYILCIYKIYQIYIYYAHVSWPFYAVARAQLLRPAAPFSLAEYPPLYYVYMS